MTSATTVDLRSDTVTRPTPAMRRAMAEAEVGDDGYGEDPTVRRLEEVFALRLGKEAALFLPSGTMANQVALRVLTRPGDAVIAGGRQHIVSYEDGAGPINAGVTFLPLDDSTGVLAPHEIHLAKEGGSAHLPTPTLVAIEDTHMAAGGAPWPLDALRAAYAQAADDHLAVHLDGARLWHNEVATGVPVATLAEGATTVTCCLSKGLGAPVGSLLAADTEVVTEGRRARHRLGGAMRQAGVLAAAGLVALEQHVERLADDHRRAARLADAVAQRWPDIGFDPANVLTNMVVFRPPDPAGLLSHLQAEGIRAGLLAPGVVRFVTHIDVDDVGIEAAIKAVAAAPR